jgi:hypothetical protein
MAFGSATARQGICALIFNATTWAGWADNTASSPNTNVYSTLHTADPTSGNQTTSEASYTGATRVAVARTSGGWTCSAGVATNVAAVVHGACSSGSNTISHVSLGKAASSTGEVVTAGAVTTPLAVSAGITPQFAISGISVTIA